MRHILLLPTELRLIILVYVLTIQRVRLTKDNVIATDTAVLQTCHKLRREGKPVLHRHLRFAPALAAAVHNFNLHLVDDVLRPRLRGPETARAPLDHLTIIIELGKRPLHPFSSHIHEPIHVFRLLRAQPALQYTEVRWQSEIDAAVCDWSHRDLQALRVELLRSLYIDIGVLDMVTLDNAIEKVRDELRELEHQKVAEELEAFRLCQSGLFSRLRRRVLEQCAGRRERKL